MNDIAPGLAGFIVVMGVSGTGKTEIAQRLAAALPGSFIEADSLHSRAHVEQMRRGQPLTDADRWPWLEAVCAAAVAERSRPVVVACSALKRSYRDFIRARLEPVRFVFLDGPAELIAARMRARAGHFATVSLLESQLATLEAPDADEDVIRADIALSPERIVADAARALRTGASAA